MRIAQEFNTLYNDLIVRHVNKTGNSPDLMHRIIYSGVALLGYGIYRKLQYVADQHLPDTSDYEWMQKHAKSRGLGIISGEPTDELLARITDYDQNPPAGGNGPDWERWCKEVSYTHDAGESTEWVETVKDAVRHENARGGGTINLVITSDRSEAGYEEVPTAELISAVEDYLETVRPLGIWDYLVVGATHLDVDVTMAISAEDLSPTITATGQQVIAYLKSIPPRRGLSAAMLTSIAISAGATDAVVSEPAANVAVDDGPLLYQRIWVGTVSIGVIS